MRTHLCVYRGLIYEALPGPHFIIGGEPFGGYLQVVDVMDEHWNGILDAQWDPYQSLEDGHHSAVPPQLFIYAGNVDEAPMLWSL